MWIIYNEGKHSSHIFESSYDHCQKKKLVVYDEVADTIQLIPFYQLRFGSCDKIIWFLLKEYERTGENFNLDLTHEKFFSWGLKAWLMVISGT